MNCKVIQDLLPNYIENLTSEETNLLIENHIENCKECRKIKENMEKGLKNDKAKIDEREVQYMKKINNKLKILKIALLSILIVALIIISLLYCRTLELKNLYMNSNEKAVNDLYNAFLAIENAGLKLERNEDGTMVLVEREYMVERVEE